MRSYGLAFLFAVLALASSPAIADPPAPPLDSSGKTAPGLTSEQRAAISDWTTEIRIIPKEFYGNFEKIDNFIRTNPDPEYRQLHGNANFQKAVAILAGINRDRTMPKPEPSQIEGGKPAPDQSRERRAQGSEDYYRRLGENLGNQPWPYNESGKSAYQRKDFRAALRDYERAIGIDPENAPAMLGYGHSAYELGDYKLALMAARQLLARDSANKEALGLYHFANGRAPTVSLPSAIFQGGQAEPGGMNAGADGLRPNPGGAAPMGGYNAPSQTPEQAAAAARAQAAASGPGSAERSAAITKDAESAL
ncbi:MAG: tetratricopeptide repeat protein, partial [Elusimicrobiota bacterium]